MYIYNIYIYIYIYISVCVCVYIYICVCVCVCVGGGVLCKSSFSPSNSIILGVKNCGKSLVYCKYIKEGIEHTFKTVDKIFEIRVPFNCESKNLI